MSCDLYIYHSGVEDHNQNNGRIDANRYAPIKLHSHSPSQKYIIKGTI